MHSFSKSDIQDVVSKLHATILLGGTGWASAKDAYLCQTIGVLIKPEKGESQFGQSISVLITLYDEYTSITFFDNDGDHLCASGDGYELKVTCNDGKIYVFSLDIVDGVFLMDKDETDEFVKILCSQCVIRVLIDGGSIKVLTSIEAFGFHKMLRSN